MNILARQSRNQTIGSPLSHRAHGAFVFIPGRETAAGYKKALTVSVFHRSPSPDL